MTAGMEEWPGVQLVAAVGWSLLRWSAPCLASMAALLLVFMVYFYAPYWKVRKVPGPPPSPLVGHLPLLAKYGPDAFRLLAKEYGPIYRFHMGRQPLVIVADPELCREVGIKKFKDMKNRTSPSPTSGSPLHEKGLFLTRDARWASMRNAIIPYYQPSHLSRLVPTMQSFIETATQDLSSNGGGGADEIINFSHVSLKLAIDVIGNCAFGFDFGLSRPPPAAAAEGSSDYSGEASGFLKQHIYSTESLKMDLTGSISIILGLVAPVLQPLFRCLLGRIPGTTDQRGGEEGAGPRSWELAPPTSCPRYCSQLPVLEQFQVEAERRIGPLPHAVDGDGRRRRRRQGRRSPGRRDGGHSEHHRPQAHGFHPHLHPHGGGGPPGGRPPGAAAPGLPQSSPFPRLVRQPGLRRRQNPFLLLHPAADHRPGGGRRRRLPFRPAYRRRPALPRALREEDQLGRHGQVRQELGQEAEAHGAPGVARRRRRRPRPDAPGRERGSEPLHPEELEEEAVAGDRQPDPERALHHHVPLRAPQARPPPRAPGAVVGEGRRRAPKCVLPEGGRPPGRARPHGLRSRPPPRHLPLSIRPVRALLGLQPAQPPRRRREPLPRRGRRRARRRRGVRRLRPAGQEGGGAAAGGRGSGGAARGAGHEAGGEAGGAEPAGGGDAAGVGGGPLRLLRRPRRGLPLLLLHLLRVRVEHGAAGLRQHVRAHRHLPAAGRLPRLGLHRRRAQHRRLGDAAGRADLRRRSLRLRPPLRRLLANPDAEEVSAAGQRLLLRLGGADGLLPVAALLDVLAGAGGAHRQLLRRRGGQLLQEGGDPLVAGGGGGTEHYAGVPATSRRRQLGAGGGVSGTAAGVAGQELLLPAGGRRHGHERQGCRLLRGRSR